MRFKTFPIFLAFFAMGFGDVVGTLVGFATSQFEISKGMAGLLPFVGLIMFGILSVPAGVLADKKGKKFIIILGLIIAFIGLIIPVISISKYIFLLIAILLLGSGMTILQVGGNPIMRDVSAPGKYSRNLTFAQFIKAIGSLSGPLLATWFIAIGFVWNGIFPVYAAVVLIAMLSIAILKIQEQVDEKKERASLTSSFVLLKNPYIFSMVFGLFLYVGAEVGMNSWIATYLSDIYDLDIKSIATLGIGFFFFALMIGRLLGSVILNWLSAKKFFLITSILACIGIMGLFVGIQTVAICCIFLIGLSFGNIFPLVFSILIEEMPDKSNELSGLMCMAIVGGAIMPLIMGLIADNSIMASFLVPLISLIFILITAVTSLKKN
jgi:fucose permease